jgi:hypothetical protein
MHRWLRSKPNTPDFPWSQEDKVNTAITSWVPWRMERRVGGLGDGETP